MNILFVSEYYIPHIGGEEVVFTNLAEILVKLGHTVFVVTSRLPNTSEYEELNGVKVFRVNVPHKGDRYWFAILSIPKVYKLAKKSDIIHTTPWASAFPAWFVSALLRKKSVMTVHEILCSMWKNLPDINWFNAKLHQILEKMIISLDFNKLVCVSYFTKNSLRLCGIKDSKLAMIYNGIDYNLFDPSSTDGVEIRKKFGLDNDFIYMFYGRPGISKGVEYLLKSIPIISAQIPNSKLLLILAHDPIDRYEKILKMIEDLNIKDNVILLDSVPREELPDYIDSSNCVVIPSLAEGFGFTTVEACAMNKPIVATDVGSRPEVVSGRYVLVEPRNPEAIAEGVEKVYKGEVDDSGMRIFNWDECVKKYLGIYEEILK